MAINARYHFTISNDDGDSLSKSPFGGQDIKRYSPNIELRGDPLICVLDPAVFAN
jgi:hypothetical protein